MIGVCEKDLDGAIGSEFGVIKERDAAGFECGCGLMSVFDGEGDVVVSGGSLEHLHREPGRAALGMFFDEMHERCTCLEPCSAEGKRRAWHFCHSEHIDVEAAACFDIADDEGDMIKLADTYGGLHEEGSSLAGSGFSS
ncbi:MAG: hypothetical protein RL215_1876 [Planctomycetota bacterium]